MTAFRSILLQLDASPRSAARLAFARTLAVEQAAALSAMFVAAPRRRPVQLAFAESPAALLQPPNGADVEAAKASFDRCVAEGGPAMRWVETGSGDPVDAFCLQALYADLLVLGQSDVGPSDGGGVPEGFVESVLIGSGRPALILPSEGQFATVGRDVLIGWNGRPQAAHAVSAALPWLRTAKRVHVLEAMSEEQRPAGALDIAQYLQFHGVVAALHRHRGNGQDAGETLLSFACDVDADLLVMGCYGHSRARELVLGGASRTVLRSMTLPVLMAH
ncbi:MAG TPA: universal stress protein [Albitalea sp.]|nr:universal stress protein [Albitalea sp.]